MVLDKQGVNQVLEILLKFVEQEGNKTVVEFIEGWNKNNKNLIERI
jgi:hypothetical protein